MMTLGELTAALAVINWNISFLRSVLFRDTAALSDFERTALRLVLKGDWLDTSKIVELEGSSVSIAARFSSFLAAALHLYAEVPRPVPTEPTADGTTVPVPPPSSPRFVLPALPNIPTSSLTALLDGEFPDMELHGTKHRRDDNNDKNTAGKQPLAKKARAPRMLTNFELTKYEDLELKISRYADSHAALLKAVKFMHVDVSASLNIQQQVLRTMCCQFPFLLNMPHAISRVLPEMKIVAVRVAASAKSNISANSVAYGRRLLSHCPVLPEENDPTWLIAGEDEPKL
ncbi:hypothetical protein AURDEDRAFT_175410 [Auricularia subglabra TFB-10046 SS5]|nr:hypothetical protein AURDEDRAFT_175410 [Auricularia subglabra TFB-10046 SS5]